MLQRPDHNTGNSEPFSFRTVCWVLLPPAELWTMKSCGTGPTVYRPYLRRLKSLTICRCNCNEASLFIQLFNDPECWSVQGLNPRPPPRLCDSQPIMLTCRRLSVGNRGRIELSGDSTYSLRVRTPSKSHATPLGRLTCPMLIVPKYMTHHDLWVSLGVNFIGDVRNEQEFLCQRRKLPVRLKLADVACKELRNHKQKEIRSLKTDHFTVVCLVAWPFEWKWG